MYCTFFRQEWASFYVKLQTTNKNQYEINVENSNRLASISNDKLTVILLLFILQKELHVRGLFLKIRF